MKAWIKEEIKNSPSIVSSIRWYKGLNRKQQLLVNVLLSAASSLIFFSSIVSSGIDNLEANNQSYMKSEKLYERVINNVDALKTLSNIPTGFIDRPSNELQTIIDNSLKRYEIEPDSISNIGSSKVSLEFIDVSFQKLSEFIRYIEDERVGIDSFYVEPKSNGDVNFSIVLD